MSSVRAGDRFVTTEDVTALGQTHWTAPFTGGFEAVIPEGTVLVVPDDGV